MANAIIESNEIQTLDIRKELTIAAPIETTFEVMLEQIGSHNQMPDGTPYPLKLEAWPGGRWFRDLGNNTGHLWGHVQVIKPPILLEVRGPLMMSYPATNFVQYRLTAQDGGTLLTFQHRAIGLISPSHREGLQIGWGDWCDRIGRVAEQKGTARNRR